MEEKKKKKQKQKQKIDIVFFHKLAARDLLVKMGYLYLFLLFFFFFIIFLLSYSVTDFNFNILLLNKKNGLWHGFINSTPCDGKGNTKSITRALMSYCLFG